MARSLRYRPTMKMRLWAIAGILIWSLFVMALDGFGRVGLPVKWIFIGTAVISLVANATAFEFRSRISR
jgi:hypothetical protein